MSHFSHVKLQNYTLTRSVSITQGQLTIGSSYEYSPLRRYKGLKGNNAKG